MSDPTSFDAVLNHYNKLQSVIPDETPIRIAANENDTEAPMAEELFREYQEKFGEHKLEIIKTNKDSKEPLQGLIEEAIAHKEANQNNENNRSVQEALTSAHQLKGKDQGNVLKLADSFLSDNKDPEKLFKEQKNNIKLGKPALEVERKKDCKC